MMYIMSDTFINTKITFKRKYIFLSIIPMINLLAIFTNDFHHLFYVKYSFNVNEIQGGPCGNLHLIYTYGLLVVSMLRLFMHSAKTSGFFSKQSVLIVVATFIPITANMLGVFNIINTTVYTTPISFAMTCVCYYVAIFRFGFLSITPIALEKVVDRMSDGYLVLNDKNVIVDFNKPFIEIFQLNADNIRNIDIYSLKDDICFPELENAIQNVSVSPKTISYENYYTKINKYFHIEVSSITGNNTFLGTLILFKDVTQHEEDMQAIKDNQDMLVERERFASLGMMIGGIAHNLKTPIMSIAGAVEALNDLITEYDTSIGDADVTNDDHHAIAEDMRSWVSKVKTHTSYMSDVITAVKGQAISSNDSIDTFTIDEIIKRVSILMKHELKHSLVELYCDIKISPDFKIRGNINSLVQVINNLISNAIQSYNGAPDNQIDLSVDKKDNNLIISIKDYGSGMPQEVQDKLFKEMITTKGKNRYWSWAIYFLF